MSGTESSSRVGEVACGTCTRTHGLGMTSFQDEVKGFLIQQILNALSPIAGPGTALVQPRNDVVCPSRRRYNRVGHPQRFLVLSLRTHVTTELAFIPRPHALRLQRDFLIVR